MAQEKRSNYEVRRVNYFQGMMLVDQDFTDEQSYHLQMRQNHNLELHTWGVVRGLNVNVNSESGEVTVEEGVAIAADGKELWWPSGSTELRVTPEEEKYLVMEWNKQLKEEYPQLSGKYLRLLDTARFLLKSAREKRDDDLVLAFLSKRVAENNVRRTAKSVRTIDNSIEISPVTKDGSLRLMTGAPMTARLTIEASGNVGIGTAAAPRAGLDVNGSIWAKGNWGENEKAALTLEGNKPTIRFVGDSTSGNREWLIHNSGYGPGNLEFFERTRANRTEPILSISPAGRVGVRTSAPSSLLQVRATPANIGGASFFDEASAMFACRENNGGYAPKEPETVMVLAREGVEGQSYANFARFDMGVYDGSKTQLTIRLNHSALNSEGNNTPAILSLRSNGTVGIGTTNPNFAFTIQGKGGTHLNLRSSDADAEVLLGVDSSGGIVSTLSNHDLQLRTGRNATRMTIKADGRIGIGTPAPDTDLVIFKKAANAIGPILTLYNDGSGRGAGGAIDFNGYNVERNPATARIASLDDANYSSILAFYTKEPGGLGNVLKERLRIASGGNVGVGTTTPKMRLEIAGTGGNPNSVGDSPVGVLRIGATNNSVLDFGITDATPFSNWIQSADKSQASVYYPLSLNPNGGNVGIGTKAPGGTLHIRRDVTGAAGPTLLIHNAGGGTNAEARIDMATYNFGDQAPSFRLQVIDDGHHGAQVNLSTKLTGANTNALASRLYIKSDGSVGLGTTIPDNALTIQGKAGGTYLNVKSIDGPAEVLLGADAGGGIVSTMSNHDLQLRAGGNTIKMTIRANGNVGIGTTTAGGKLEIKGTEAGAIIKFGGLGGDVHHLSCGKGLVFNSVTGDFYFRKTNYDNLASYEDEMRIDSSGNVTIKGSIGCGGKIYLKTHHGTWVNANADQSSMRQAGAPNIHEQFIIEMACSREFKENISDLTAEEALTTLQNLTPIRYDYKGEKSFRQNLGFIAEDMPDNLASYDRRSISPFEVIPVLTRVAKEQQQSIKALQETIRALQDEVQRHNTIS
jgi:hypothetical protein